MAEERQATLPFLVVGSSLSSQTSLIRPLPAGSGLWTFWVKLAWPFEVLSLNPPSKVECNLPSPIHHPCNFPCSLKELEAFIFDLQHPSHALQQSGSFIFGTPCSSDHPSDPPRFIFDLQALIHHSSTPHSLQQSVGHSFLTLTPFHHPSDPPLALHKSWT